MINKTIAKIASDSINDSVEYYFTVLANTSTVKEEYVGMIKFIDELQGWLFFTEPNIKYVYDKLTDSSEIINLFSNITIIFYSRLAEHVVDLNEYENKLCDALTNIFVVNKENSETNLLPDVYTKRLFDKETIHGLLSGNRLLVTMVCLYLFVDNRPKL